MANIPLRTTGSGITNTEVGTPAAPAAPSPAVVPTPTVPNLTGHDRAIANGAPGAIKNWGPEGLRLPGAVPSMPGATVPAPAAPVLPTVARVPQMTGGLTGREGIPGFRANPVFNNHSKKFNASHFSDGVKKGFGKGSKKGY